LSILAGSCPYRRIFRPRRLSHRASVGRQLGRQFLNRITPGVPCLASIRPEVPLGLGGLARSSLVGGLGVSASSCPCRSTLRRSPHRTARERHLGRQPLNRTPPGVPSSAMTRPERPLGRGDLARSSLVCGFSALACSCPYRRARRCSHHRTARERRLGRQLLNRSPPGVPCLASIRHRCPLGRGGLARSRLVGDSSVLPSSCPYQRARRCGSHRTARERPLGRHLLHRSPLEVSCSASTRPERPLGRGGLARPSLGSDLSALASSCPYCPYWRFRRRSPHRTARERRLGRQPLNRSPPEVSCIASIRPEHPLGLGGLARSRLGSDLSALTSSCSYRPSRRSRRSRPHRTALERRLGRLLLT
jgi:hypothetical protein